jgi:HTH-type transcriptional regulator/antitoxin HigA
MKQMKTFSLGQKWVSRVTSSDQPDVPVMGASKIPLPGAAELKALLDGLSRSETVREMSRRKWLKPVLASARDKVSERGVALLEFLTAGRAAMPSLAMFKGRLPSPRRDLLDEVATCAWITRVADVARQSKATKFKPSSITNEFIRSITKLSTRSRGPKVVLDAVREIGICVVVESGLPGMSVDGASFHTMQTGPVVALTLRHDRLDNFWFTLFHELGHIHLHLSEPTEDVFIDSEEDENDEMEVEAEANAFAKDSLVPRDTWLRSDARRLGDESSVVQLARQLGIHPAIVAGRIRYERREFRIFSDLIGIGEVRETVFAS